MTAAITANDALRAAIPQLRDARIQDPARDARILLGHALHIPANRLTLHLSDPMPADAATRFATMIAARLRYQPIAQIIGQRLFWGRPFIVTPDVLDPRPETETLIAHALKTTAETILDLGTGSGAILLTLLAEWPQATGLGTDISGPALTIAEANASALNLTTRAKLTLSNWYAQIDGTYDLIVSNPPYIAAAEMPHLSLEVRNWEPHIALTPGGDGLDAYRAITAGAPAHLTPHGRLMVEIGPTQGQPVQAMFLAAGLTNITILQDLDGRDRVVSGQQP
jgi:release factor glutamine methyltransferase